MIKILLILICLSLVGCAVTPKIRLEIQMLETQIAELKDSLLKKEQEIKRLQGLLKEKERLLQEKDSKIESLRKKLGTFGVFE